jgi:hypothetical protein
MDNSLLDKLKELGRQVLD